MQQKITKNNGILVLILLFALLGFSSKVQAQYNGYKTGIGLRGGYTSGLTIKHFVNSDEAIEGIVGTRFRGLSLTGLYEWHTGNPVKTSGLKLE